MCQHFPLFDTKSSDVVKANSAGEDFWAAVVVERGLIHMRHQSHSYPQECWRRFLGN